MHAWPGSLPPLLRINAPLQGILHKAFATQRDSPTVSRHPCEMIPEGALRQMMTHGHPACDDTLWPFFKSLLHRAAAVFCCSRQMRMKLELDSLLAGCQPWRLVQEQPAVHCMLHRVHAHK